MSLPMAARADGDQIRQLVLPAFADRQDVMHGEIAIGTASRALEPVAAHRLRP